MDIEKEIMKVLLDAKRRGIEVNSILVGSKEIKEMFDNLEKPDDTETVTAFEMNFGTENADKYSIRVFKVNEDSFLRAAYVIDHEKPAIKVSDLIKDKK